MAYIQLSDIGITGVVTAVPKNKINNNDLTTEFGEKHIHKFIKTTGCLLYTSPSPRDTR